MFDIRIVAVLCANDDGSQAVVPSTASLTTYVDVANQAYNPVGVNLLFDPATDIYRFNDDRLNRDCTRRDHAVYTVKDVDPNKDPAFEADVFNRYRNEIGLRFPGRITVYFSTGGLYNWNDGETRWIYGPRSFSWSSQDDEFVAMAAHREDDHLAHEIGHYLHLPHTHLVEPKDVADAIAQIQHFVDVDHGSKDAVKAALFDCDGQAQVHQWDMITDTPADPTAIVFNNQCDPAETSASLKVTFADKTVKTYTFTPDRENVMSYWHKTCRGGVPRLTPGQSKRVHQALRQGNRRHLIEPAVLYYGVFGEGDRSQTRAIGWSLDDFALRYDAELKAGRRCVHMQAYDLGGGQIRYDGVWEPAAGIGQTRAIGWSLNDFAQRYNDELKAGRRGVHMQAYDLGGGQIRYDGIWDGGDDRAQTRAIGWALNDVAKRFDDELRATKRCVHMQAYDLGGGQIRYDGIWEKGDGVTQTRAISWALGDFATRFDAELKAGRRCVHTQAYDLGGGQIRYDGIWESGGNHGQSRALGWAFNDFVRRWEQEAGKGRRLVHMQAYDLGGGQIRYDGIWEAAAGPQRRVLGLPLATFADHFDEATSSGMHVEHMSAFLRSYDDLSTTTRVAVQSAAARRTVTFGSDFEQRPASLAALPVPPLTGRNFGCDLQA